MLTSLSTFQKNTTSFMTKEDTCLIVILKKVPLEAAEAVAEAEAEEEITEEACNGKRILEWIDLIKKVLQPL